MISSLYVPYGQGLGKSLREIEKQIEACHHDFSLHSKETVSATLSRLKGKGIVASRGSRKKAVWSITARGKNHFKDMNIGGELPSEDGKVRLVIYDIPEKMKYQRVWLRNKLSDCDYIYLQKSVWLGTRPLPKELQNELKDRKLLSYVHIVGLEGFLEGAHVN